MLLTDYKSHNRPVYFLHIPKTAGTTFISVLHRYFSADEVCPAYLWHDLLKIQPDLIMEYQLFRGHFYYYVTIVLPRKPTFITMLRDPVERTISHYEHIRRETGHYFHQKAIKQKNLEEFLRDTETQPMVANFQTRAIALDLDPVSIAASLSEADLGNLALERILESAVPIDIPDHVLLQRAKERLQQFAFIGLAERFQESISLLCNTFGWAPVDDFPNLNVTAERLKREQIDTRTLEMIQEYTALDAELYQYGQELFETQLDQIRMGL